MAQVQLQDATAGSMPGARGGVQNRSGIGPDIAPVREAGKGAAAFHDGVDGRVVNAAEAVGAGRNPQRRVVRSVGSR